MEANTKIPINDKTKISSIKIKIEEKDKKEISQNAINKNLEVLINTNNTKGTMCPLISGGVNYII
jgi:hypothetical protein